MSGSALQTVAEELPAKLQTHQINISTT